MSKIITIMLLTLLCATGAVAQWDFDQAETVEQARPLGGKGLAVDEDGNACVLPIVDGDLFVRWRPWNGGWSDNVRVSDSSLTAPIFEASIAWNSDTEEPVIVYAAGQRIYVAQRTGQDQWDNTAITDSTETALSPDIACYDGAIYIVWIDETGDNYQLKYAYGFGNEWERGEIVAELGAFGSGASPRIAVDHNLAGHVLFRGVVAGAYAAQHATNEFLGNDEWIVTTLQVPHAEGYPGDIVFSEHDGHIHCVSQGSEGFGIPRQAYYHERDWDGNWTFGTNMSGDVFAGEPRVAVTSDTLAHGLWLGLSGNFYTGELGFWSESAWWEDGIIFGNADGDVAFAIDESNYGHLLVSDASGGTTYLQSTTGLVPPFWGPEISIEPDTLDFDTVFVGQDSTLVVQLHNPNEDILRITGFELNSPVFHGPEEWHTIELWWGQSTTVEIRFEPLLNTIYNGYAVVVSNAHTSPDTIFLTGRGALSNAVPDLSLPSEFVLHQLYPNPFNGSVNVSFSLPRENDVTLRVYDVTGRELETLVNRKMSAGTHNLQWSCNDCATGVYLFRLESAERSVVQKAALVK